MFQIDLNSDLKEEPDLKSKRCCALLELVCQDPEYVV